MPHFSKRSSFAKAAVLFIFISFAQALPVRSQEQVPMLRGQATQYAEAIKPLDPLLWPGNNFDKQAAESLLKDPSQNSALWAEIPEWQSGEWESKQAVNTRAIKYINGTPVDVQPIGVHTSEGRFTKGILKDKKGLIWHLFQSNYWTDTDLGDFKIQSYVMYSAPGSGDHDFYAESVDFKVSKANNQIGSVRRAKSWTRYTNLSPGTIKEETIRTNYDEQGRPTATSFNSALSKRIASFNTYEPGFAAKSAIVASLNKHLRQRGMEAHVLGQSTQAAPAPKSSNSSKR